jgi:hypothetical protein
MITVLVEGDTDVPFVTRLCEVSGFKVKAPRIAGGKPKLDPLIPGFAKAGQGSPHLVVRDLDLDAECAPAWLATKWPRVAGPYFALRLAVRAIEAWFLADRDNAASALHIPLEKLPLEPDKEADPKRAIVNLARLSTKKSVREAIVPAAGISRKAGQGYEAWLIGAAQRWSIERAMPNSPSLARAHRRLLALRVAWTSVQG